MIGALKSTLNRIFAAYALAIVGALAGALLLYVAMQITGSDFGLDTLRPGGLLGGVGGILVGLMLTPRKSNTAIAETKSAKTFKATVYMVGAILSSFALVMAVLQGRIHLPEMGKRATLDSTRFASWSDSPGLFLFCVVVWATLGIVCFRLAKLEWSERNDLN